MVNPAFVIENWGGSDATLKINGEQARQGRNFHIGTRHTLQGTDLIVWLRAESNQPLKVTMISVNQ